MMNAAQLKRYGGSDAVELSETAQPLLSAGQLLVKVHAAGVNPIDWKIREGYLQQMMPLHLPATLGGDFSGVVVEAGKDAAGFRKGDEVYGQASVLGGGSGSFAEFASAAATTVAQKPKRLSHIEAAALPLAGVSAWQAITDHLQLAKGQRILIHGGAGGIGTFAVQIAKWRGAYVAATVDARDAQYVQGLGADEVIDYRLQQFDEILHGYDAVLDLVGGETYARSFSVLKKGGTIVSLLEQPNAELMKRSGVNAIGQFTQVSTERLVRLADLADRQAINVHVDKVFSLSQAGEALAYLQAGHSRGKVVLRVSGE